MSGVVIRLVHRSDGRATPADGRYVVHYDPELIGGAYTLDTTSDPARAKRFPSLEKAIEYYRAVCPNQPEDSPGHTNRPLTAYTAVFERSP